MGGVLAFLIQLFVRVPNLYGGGVAKVEEKAEEAAPAPKEIQQEIIKDKPNYWINTVKKRKPKYLLAYKDLFEGENADYYKKHYKLLKEFRINNHLNSDYTILEKIYKLKPSGTDYNLYERIK